MKVANSSIVGHNLHSAVNDTVLLNLLILCVRNFFYIKMYTSNVILVTIS